MRSDSSELSFGIIGCGRVVEELHVPAWMRIPNVDCTAVCDLSTAERTAIADQLNAADSYAAADALLETPNRLDFVVVATPGPTHSTLTMKALNRGLHVLCEKPIAYSQSELAEIAQVAADNGKSVCPIHNYRFKPVTQDARSQFDGPEPIEHVSLRWRIGPLETEHAPWLRQEKDNQLMLFDFSYHFLDILCWLVGGAPEILHLDVQSTDEAVESIVANLRFPAATATVDLRLNSPSSSTTLEIIGTDCTGVLEFYPDGFRVASGVDTPVHRGLGDLRRTLAYGLRYLAAQSTFGLPQKALGHYRIFSRFVSALQRDGSNPVPISSVEPTIRLLERLGEAAYSSVDSSHHS